MTNTSDLKLNIAAVMSNVRVFSDDGVATVNFDVAFESDRALGHNSQMNVRGEEAIKMLAQAESRKLPLEGSICMLLLSDCCCYVSFAGLAPIAQISGVQVEDNEDVPGVMFQVNFGSAATIYLRGAKARKLIDETTIRRMPLEGAHCYVVISHDLFVDFAGLAPNRQA